tara:strand:- start:23813 stop:24310 length:498 start_codon:yes stop_codon:yes gene_type:complete
MRVGFALGSNLGDRLANLQLGRKELCDRLEDPEPLCSSLYETQPVDCPPGSSTFYNTVIELQTDLSPEQLLMITQSIEAAAGRVPSETTNAPRELDIDILYMGQESVETAVLKIPHPSLHERSFVLQPLAEIRPELELPGLPTIQCLLQVMPDEEFAPVKIQSEW